jgi:hypothetical protein
VNVRVDEIDGYEEVAIVPANRPGDHGRRAA